MKKKFYTILFICTPVTAFSQRTSSIRFGIKAGIAFSNNNIESLDTTYAFSLSGKTGIIFGVYVNMPIGRTVNFQPNLLYVRKGYKQNFISNGENFSLKMYHGFHQRRVGCYSGSRSVYVDSAGDVHACPFCHNKSYNIIDLVRKNVSQLPAKENKCPQFGKIA